MSLLAQFYGATVIIALAASKWWQIPEWWTDKNNWVNQNMVKLGWAWTVLPCAVLLVTSRSNTRQFVDTVASTAYWRVVVSSFHFLHVYNPLARCSDPRHLTYHECRA